eukprot:1180576-Prorocentrum_minimum.AAC.4
MSRSVAIQFPPCRNTRTSFTKKTNPPVVASTELRTVRTPKGNSTRWLRRACFKGAHEMCSPPSLPPPWGGPEGEMWGATAMEAVTSYSRGHPWVWGHHRDKSRPEMLNSRSTADAPPARI